MYDDVFVLGDNLKFILSAIIKFHRNLWRNMNLVMCVLTETAIKNSKIY